MSECRGQGYDNMTSRSPGKYLRNNSEALNDPHGSQNLDLLLGGVTMVKAINFFGILQYTTNFQRHHLVGTSCRRVIPIHIKKRAVKRRISTRTQSYKICT
jgi:hypothetical protein